jgi:cytidylate kinase
MPIIIAIDGPAAAGKGTISMALSKEFAIPHMDTGKIYRAAAARGLEKGLCEVYAAKSIIPSDFLRENLRDENVSQEASRISAIPDVRRVLDDMQIAFANQSGGAILDGRDIASTIAPNAHVKLFVTADVNIRARRRFNELAQSGAETTYDDVLKEMKIRDERDQSRAASPLAATENSIIIDTTFMTIQEAVQAAYEAADQAFIKASNQIDIDQKWDKRFLEMAEMVATWSKDPSTKVGCVIVDQERVVLGMGYNGFPRGVCDCEERLNDRSVKYLMVQHAEANAITNASASLKGSTAYVTHAPCANCAGLMIQAGIKKIFTRPTPAGLAERFKDSYTASNIMLTESGVEIVYIP